MKRIALDQIDEALQDLVLGCEEVVIACDHCVNSIIGREGLGQVIRACRDCADIASLSARMLARHAELSPEICEILSKACRICIEETGKHEDDDLGVYSEVFRTCEALCNELVA